jgi:hypothetical protein
MTVCVGDAHAHVQKLVLVVNMATVFEEYYRKVAFCYAFLWTKELSAKVIIKKYFVFMMRSVCRVKRFTTGREIL